MPAVPARASVWQEPHFCTNCALPFARSGSSRPQAPRDSASATAHERRQRGLTVFRVRLTGREHYPLRTVAGAPACDHALRHALPGVPAGGLRGQRGARPLALVAGPA